MPTSDSLRADTLALLDRYEIDHWGWQWPGSKSVDALVDEIARGESRLVEEGVRLIRVTHVVFMHVDATYEGQDLRLVEVRQVDTATGRSRSRDIPASVAEKVGDGEEVLEAATRGLSEELGFEVDPGRLELFGASQDEKDSASYPGLANRQYAFWVRVTFSEDEFLACRAGVTEIRDGIETVFAWRPID
jgi:hypothetical protein